MGGADLKAGRFAVVQELSFQTAKLSYLGCAQQKGVLFADC